MKATILHDENGAILAISRIGDLCAAGSNFASAGLVAGPGQRVLQVELSAEHGRMSLRELHEGHRVDVAASKLVRKS